MSLTKKIWHDENSEPPKNYLWAKGGKLFKNIEGQWKEVSKKESEDEGSGGDASEEVTIDDVVKFMHDTIAATGYGEIFPYETWNEIPDIINAAANIVGKSTTNSTLMQDVFLSLPGYIIGMPKTM